MVEALASVALLAVGVVAAMSALSSMTRGEARLLEGERMQRLADEKLAEMVATGDFEFETQGNFEDRNESRYSWTASLEPSGVENVDIFRVEVVRANEDSGTGYTASQLVFIRPTTTQGGAGG